MTMVPHQPHLQQFWRDIEPHICTRILRSLNVQNTFICWREIHHPIPIALPILLTKEILHQWKINRSFINFHRTISEGFCISQRPRILQSTLAILVAQDRSTSYSFKEFPHRACNNGSCRLSCSFRVCQDMARGIWSPWFGTMLMPFGHTPNPFENHAFDIQEWSEAYPWRLLLASFVLFLGNCINYMEMAPNS